MLGSTVHSYVTKIFVIVPFCSYKPMQAEAAASLNDCKKKYPTSTLLQFVNVIVLVPPYIIMLMVCHEYG